MADDHQNDDQTQSYLVLSQGTMVEHYRIIEKIGAGGMGEVYLAEDTRLKRQVALKFLPAQFAGDEDMKARFTREAQAAATLKHPNIVTVYEVGKYQGRPFFAMECCEGPPLRDLINEQKLTLDQISNLALQICEGLQEAHEAGIVHRDIKPSNIILDKKGRPKLVDFGLATVRGSEKLTRTGSTLGTIGYMSPEQIQGKEVDQRSDLFSFGVVLYEMIAGRLPFMGDSEAAILNSVLNDIPEPLSRYKSGVSGSLQQIVSKLLEKDPALRYQNAAGVISDLKRLTDGVGRVEEKPPPDWWNRYVVPAAVLVLIAMAIYWMTLRQSADDSNAIKSLVVLPFENLGAAEDEYFADGITDEITARLAGIGSLRVISRTSAMLYKNSDKPLKQIGKELDIDYVLEGTIRWDKSTEPSRVRIIPQLIKVADDSHLWAETFERALTQVFAVQAEIATHISEALNVTLLESEKQLLAAKPTDNLQAYDFYLRGKQYWDQTDLVQAVHMFEKAVDLDSNFYPAYAWLARLYGFGYINDLKLIERPRVRAKEAAEKAFQLAAGKPDGYMALGSYHYYVSRDYERAVELFEQALQGQANNSELIALIAYAQRRKGNWDAAVAGLQRALKLNPLSQANANGLRETLIRMHRIEEAKEVTDRALELAPDNAMFHFWQGAMCFYLGRDTSEVSAAWREFARLAPANLAAKGFEEIFIGARDYQSALNCRTAPDWQTSGDSVDFYTQKGHIYRFMGDSSTSRVFFDSARVICEERIRTDPEVALYHAELAIACAGNGRKKIAVQEGELAAELLPVSTDELVGPEILSILSEVYIMVGEHDLAIDQLDYLLSHPSTVQIAEVRNHPICDPLRENPRFQALLEKYKNQ